MVQDKKPLVALCALALSTIDYDAYGSHLAFAYSCGRYATDYDFLLCTPGRMPIDQARNAAIEYSRRRGAKWIFFWDDDTILDPKTVVKLLEKAEETDIDIIQPLYFIRGNEFPVMAFVTNEEGSNVETIPDERWEKSDGELIRVQATGNGCTLYRMELFDKIDNPWFLTVPGQCTEDVHFFSKIKASGYDVNAFLDTSFSCGHIVDKMVINGDNYRLIRAMNFLDRIKDTVKKDKILTELEKETKFVADHMKKLAQEDFKSSGKFYRRGKNGVQSDEKASNAVADN